MPGSHHLRIRSRQALITPGRTYPRETARDHKWAVFTHSKKPKRWVIARHYGMFNKSRRDQWVFGDRDSGAYLHKFAWTKIIRHQMVPGTASPDDPALA